MTLTPKGVPLGRSFATAQAEHAGVRAPGTISEGVPEPWGDADPLKCTIVIIIGNTHVPGTGRSALDGLNEII